MNENVRRFRFRKISQQQEFGVILILIAIVVFFTIMKPAFVSQENIYSLLKSLAFTGIVAVGEHSSSCRETSIFPLVPPRGWAPLFPPPS